MAFFVYHSLLSCFLLSAATAAVAPETLKRYGLSQNRTKYRIESEKKLRQTNDDYYSLMMFGWPSPINLNKMNELTSESQSKPKFPVIHIESWVFFKWIIIFCLALSLSLPRHKVVEWRNGERSTLTCTLHTVCSHAQHSSVVSFYRRMNKVVCLCTLHSTLHIVYVNSSDTCDSIIFSVLFFAAISILFRVGWDNSISILTMHGRASLFVQINIAADNSYVRKSVHKITCR